MRVLGLGGLDHNGAACLVEDGEVRSFLEVERVTRRKNQGLEDEGALAAVLDRLGISAVDHVAIADRTWFRVRAPWLIPWLRGRFHGASISAHHHHACHLAAAFAASGLSGATVVSIDGKGDGLSAAAGVATRSTPPRVTFAVPSAHSLGRLWWAASDYAGLPGHHAAGKTMALAGYGEPAFRDRLARHWVQARDGGFRFLPRDEHPDLFRQVPRLVDWMARVAGSARAEGEPEEAHRNMAASVQRITEEIIEAFVTAAVARTGDRRVVIAGGVALNGLANQRLLAHGVVETLYVPPVTDDRGLALGAAALAACARSGALAAPATGLSPYLGPTPAPLTGVDAVFDRRVAGDLALSELVARLVRGEIVGWFEGGDEAGPRALGHRSILATPTLVSVRDRLNGRIKRREPWRPFGCSVLRERVGDWFECDDDSPYMLRIVQARPERQAQIPAALHVDGTSRLHTVTQQAAPRLAQLLEQLVMRRHPPLLVNTSMNGRGEPLVHTAQQAFAFARTAELDALMVEGTLFTRGTRT